MSDKTTATPGPEPTGPGAIVSDPKQRKVRYKKTLNLPQSAFPMRANLAQNEPQSRRRWDREGLYLRLLEERAGAEPFVFHDGPPYANGSIHAGHVLNKVLKDIVVRSRNLAGRRCPFVPGWDCHGLPIEHKVMTQLVDSGKIEKLNRLDDNARRMAIRRECARYAQKYQRVQAEQIERLLTLADYPNAYLTMTPAYEKAVIEVFAELVDQGLVYRDLKPVHWSVANRTALAEAELEYFEREDPSIYVRFDAGDPAAVGAAFGVELREEVSFLIWTTTPWTLAANLLIAVHDQYRYALVKIDGRPTVIARELVETVTGIAASAAVEVLGEAGGQALVGLAYEHPFCGRRGRIVAAPYVTLEDGTGLVHTAPGHGQEDYETGQREGLEVYSPVRGDGTYDDTVPEWLRGVLVWDANPLVVERLRASGHLFHDQSFRHSYPHDWRSKTPVLFRCTEQWFVAVDRPTRYGAKSLRQLALAASEEIRFIPGWGRDRLRGMLESRPDWCVSRQRSWGLPIPAFRQADGEVFLTPASVRAVGEAFGRDGSDAWFTQEPAAILADYDPAADPDAPPGLEIEGLEKMYDIFDVWFESGSSWNAVMRTPGRGFPVDLYLEGSDQHRGWFQLSLLPALGATGRSPFKSVLTHGFTVDREGRKMSKSVGNVLEIDELMRRYGADICRWWVSSLAFENDIKVDLKYFDLAADSYRKVRNTLRFLLSNLADFTPERAVDLAALEPTSLDAYALAQAAELRRRVVEAYEQYEIRQAHLLLFDFCNETLSAFYLDAIKDRLYCDPPDSPRRRASQTVLVTIADLVAALLAPILPHTADEAFRALHGPAAGSVHLRVFPELEAAADPAWPRVLEIRGAALKALEQAKEQGIENRLDAGVILADPDGTLARFAADLVDVVGTSRVELTASGDAVTVRDLRAEPRCERSWRRDPSVRERCDGGWLSDRDAAAVGIA